MKVSVIVPVHNAAEYLRACLDSVRGQTLADWQCLCIDDGSADGSAAILDEYAAADSRFVVEHRPNAGAAATRNRALELSRGEYVAFMDADDRYPSENVLERLYAAATAHGVALCGGGMSLLGIDGVVRKWNEFADGEDHGWQRPFAPERWVSAGQYPHCQGFTRFLYSRSLLKESDVVFPAYLRYEDPVFFVRALAAAGGFYGIGIETYTYRVDYRPKPKDLPRLRDYLRGLAEVAELARQHGLKALYRQARRECCGGEVRGLIGEALGRDAELAALFAKYRECFTGLGWWSLGYRLQSRLRRRFQRPERQVSP